MTTTEPRVWSLNRRAAARCGPLIEHPELYRVALHTLDSGACIVDCGVETVGSLEAGRALAEVCLAGLGRVDILPRGSAEFGPTVQVTTDHPVAACMASQYAGWQITGDKFFAMGSGPMRAAYAGESLFDQIGYQEKASQVVGVLESGKLPGDAVCQQIARDCDIETESLVLLVARTASLAGSLQVVARSVETALHKMHELGFDLSRVVSGHGAAPLPPIAADDLKAIGNTNDAILYAGEVTLWVTGDDESLTTLGPRIPSSASADHGQPFSEIFERYGRDFYQIDPLLFSPAVVTLVNLSTGQSYRFGETRPDVVRRSFGF